MKIPFIAAAALLFTFAGHSIAESPIIPKGWFKAEDLEQIQTPLQRQLDTGIAMLATAWDMALAKDAELFVVYISVFEKLPESERAALRKEQEAWLKKREKAAAKADDGTEGQIGHLASATEHQQWSEKRIAELKKRLAKK